MHKHTSILFTFSPFQDALVAAYPAIPDDSKNVYRRGMLECLL